MVCLRMGPGDEAGYPRGICHFRFLNVNFLTWASIKAGFHLHIKHRHNNISMSIRKTDNCCPYVVLTRNHRSISDISISSRRTDNELWLCCGDSKWKRYTCKRNKCVCFSFACAYVEAYVAAVLTSIVLMSLCLHVCLSLVKTSL